MSGDVPAGTSVRGVDIGGMTTEQAAATLGLALGDEVAVTDSTVGLASEVGQIAGITYRDAGVLSLRIVLWRVAALSSTAIPMGPSDTPVETPQ